MSEDFEKTVASADVRQVVHPCHSKFMGEVQSGTSLFVREIEAVLCTARIHEAAKEFIRRIVDVLGERVVCPEIQPLSKAVLEVHGNAVIRVPPSRRERGLPAPLY